jgi:predicted permease
MRGIRRFLIRLAAAITQSADERRLREELEQHVALQTAENIRAGVPAAEARRLALQKLGSVESIKEDYRNERSLPALDTLRQDVRYALRQLRKAPLFTFTATVSLGMGIGANTAVFTIVERVLLRSLPVSSPHELVYVTDQRILQEQSPRFSYPFYKAVRDNTVLNGVAARAALAVTAATNGEVARISGELVSGEYFTLLGARTQIGRPLSAEDDLTPGAHDVAVISDGFWRRGFAAHPSVLGRRITINDHTFTIVGVAATGFTGTDVGHPADVWLPLSMQREVGRDFLTDARTNWLEIIGRLSSGRSPERAAAELSSHLQRRAPELQAQFPERRIMLVPGEKGSSPVRRELGPALRVLLALTALALALACANVASLVAVRSAAREKEIAVRLALGAGRSRLTRQFLTETLVLSAAGGAAGLLAGPWAAGVLIASQPHPLGIDARLDLRVFLFGLAASVLTGLLVALAPILASRHVGLAQAFGNSSAKPAVATRRLTVHDFIVTFQIAIALAMLISAALFVQSLRRLGSVDPGFRADDVLLATLDPSAAGYSAARIERFWRDTLERVSQVRGVQTAALARIVPLGSGRQRQPVFDAASGRFIEIDANVVASRYFATLGIPLLSGRDFDDRDTKASRPVAIVNERLARTFWPEQDPIGRVLGIKGVPGGGQVEVVGLVHDVKYRDLRGDTGPMFYRPLLQTSSSDAMTLHVRAAGDPGAVARAIRREMQGLDPNVPLFAMTTLEDRLDASFAQTRQAAVLTGIFGILALLLSGIGVYGVTALAVARRTRDIGIRMALGAQPRDIVNVVGRRGIGLVTAGLGLGLVGSFAFAQITGTLVYGVSARDSATFAGMSLLLGAVSLIAFYIPLRTATRLDAVAAIRRAE